MTGKLITIMFLLAGLLKPSGSAAQTSSGWKLRLSKCLLSAGYFYEGKHVFEVGPKIEYIDLSGPWPLQRKNIGLVGGGQLLRFEGRTYIDPFVMVRYLQPLSKNFGAVVSFSYNSRHVLGRRSAALTPEAGLNWGGTTTLTYGYNLFSNKYDWISPHRVAIRLMTF